MAKSQEKQQQEQDAREFAQKYKLVVKTRKNQAPTGTATAVPKNNK